MHLDTFFVYGTLRPGQSNHGILHRLTLHTKPATVTGVQLLQDPSLPFPYARRHPTAVTVGDLLQFPDADDLAAAMTRLDHLEGYHPDDPDRSHYLRELVTAHTSDGTPVEAWMYLASPRVRLTGTHPVPGGDWLTR